MAASSAEAHGEQNPLLPQLTEYEKTLQTVAMNARMEARYLRKMTECFLSRKERLVGCLQRTEALLVCIDKRMYFERVNLVNLLKYVGGGIESRENSIKEQLAQIAGLEMAKGQDEDKLSEQTLKTIEIVNIADIAIEKQNLEKVTIASYAKQKELDSQEAALQKEKRRREERRAKAKAEKSRAGND